MVVPWEEHTLAIGLLKYYMGLVLFKPFNVVDKLQYFPILYFPEFVEVPNELSCKFLLLVKRVGH